ncbi:class I SAM-dependent methyltransferase [uncultured Sphingomonas sp.]|uniref:class I SAM-dependent methyltransferase n=1 Tax=uncultured Sphingomonas sp. TaxID=158754 RepID=UPI0035CB1032
MARYLEGARDIIAHVAERLQADLSVELWNGEVLPLGPGARSDIRFLIASPHVIARLLRSPRLMTLVEEHIAGGIQIVGGSLLDALGRWNHLNALALRRTLRPRTLIAAGWPFLFLRDRTEHRLSFSRRVRDKFGHGRDDGAMVEFHYDVSNGFYELFLDPEMQYSPGYFANETTNLADAQIAKLDRICRKLELSPNDHLLDIGCGWGGLACHAALHFGARVHGVTLSKEQLDYAQAKVHRLGLTGKITLELRDFRSIMSAAAYSKVVQVGMFEHVGVDNHDSYFGHLHHLMREGGLYLHDAITKRAPKELKNFRKLTPYMRVINRYIFPGGELDYLGLTITNLERNGFEVRDVESMREHYYLSLRHWSESLIARQSLAISLVGPERVRLWLLYLGMSAMGFWRGAMYDFQTVARKRSTGLAGFRTGRG